MGEMMDGKIKKIQLMEGEERADI